MNDSGLISQYGFLFQRGVFALYILRHLSTEQVYSFEGKDDIEIAPDNRITAIHAVSNQLIQVKSGVVDNNCFNRIIGNWLLTDNIERDSFVLVIENDLGFDIKNLDSIIDSFQRFVLDGQGKKQTAIAKRVYVKYQNDIEKKNFEQLNKSLSHFIRKIQIVRFSMEELDTKLEESFFSNYCQDIIEYDLAKKKRLQKFIDYLNRQIDDSIKRKNTYSIIFSEIMRLLSLVSSEISDNSYKIDVDSLKPSFMKKAQEIVTTGRVREVRQLSLVSQRTDFIIKGIVDDLFYKDFREVYSDIRTLEISNLESFAHDNYEEACYEVDAELNPKELYEKTLIKDLQSDILPQGPMYKKGCYIFLTGEEISNDKQITWGQENEADGCFKRS